MNPDNADNGTPSDVQTRWDYEEIVEQWYQPLFRFAAGLSNQTDAADLTQATFETLLKKGSGIRDRSKVKPWLFTTLYRLFLQQVRRGSKWTHIDIHDPNLALQAPAGDVGQNTDREAILNALALLDKKYRAPLVMFYLGDLSYKEIAAVLDAPIGTVMSRLSRGKRYLRELLEPEQTNAQSCH